MPIQLKASLTERCVDLMVRLAFLVWAILPLQRQAYADFADRQLLMDGGAGGEIDAVAGVEIGDTERFEIVDSGGELGRNAEEMEAADDA